jgi:hypothetical protein
MAMGDSANVVRGTGEEESTPGAVMLWKDATINGDGVVPDDQLPPRRHAIRTNGSPVPHRKILNSSDEFALTDGETMTNVATTIRITDLGSGISPLEQHGGHREIVACILVGMNNISLRVSQREHIEISSSYPHREYAYNFFFQHMGRQQPNHHTTRPA